MDGSVDWTYSLITFLSLIGIIFLALLIDLFLRNRKQKNHTKPDGQAPQRKKIQNLHLIQPPFSLSFFGAVMEEVAMEATPVAVLLVAAVADQVVVEAVAAAVADKTLQNKRLIRCKNSERCLQKIATIAATINIVFAKFFI